MAIKLRLQRFGSAKRPIYRVVAADARSKRDGRYLEILGHYDPKGDATVTIDEVKALAWLNQGAQPTDTVKNLLTKHGIMAKYRAQNKA